MTTINANVVADSVSPEGIRLTTLLLRYPRFIHAEFLTHRVFSRNASSSRAIPVHRLIDDVENDPVKPLFWGKNQKGMQADNELEGAELQEVQKEWQLALRSAVSHARYMADQNAHKQLVNRILEPFAHINVLVTATDWQNFFDLRDHPDAEPHIRFLAQAIKTAMGSSVPDKLSDGDWHAPFLRSDDPIDVPDRALKVSAARCARLSYFTHEGKSPDVEKDLILYYKLVGSDPIHASPTEHQATPRPGKWANLRGWKSLRTVIEES